MVYVLNINGDPLMPTERHGKVKYLLKAGKAIVVKRSPFTIQLTYEVGNYTQDIALGVDAGSKVIGISASTEAKELFAAEVAVRNDVVELLSTRRGNRRTRRNHLRYRKPRFLNRVKSKQPGWLAPSVNVKIHAHEKIIGMVYKLLPVTNLIVEVASFDIQKIKNPDIEDTEYQEGDQLGFWNVREYVLWRDGHTCQGRKGCKNKILNVHHKESRKTGGDSPDNLITLCEQCHKDYHEGKLKLIFKRGNSFRDAAFMGIMRWALFNKLKQKYPNVSYTYGYITKNTRITNKLEKSHKVDALCIAGHPEAEQLDEFLFIKQVRKHNRQIHKANFLKGHKKKLNQMPYEQLGFRLFDKVKYKNQECFITGRRTSGYFVLKTLDGKAVHNSAKYTDLQLIQKSNTFIFERRTGVSSPAYAAA
jgi:hypothetical protein